MTLAEIFLNSSHHSREFKSDPYIKPVEVKGGQVPTVLDNGRLIMQEGK